MISIIFGLYLESRYVWNFINAIWHWLSSKETSAIFLRFVTAVIASQIKPQQVYLEKYHIICLCNSAFIFWAVHCRSVFLAVVIQQFLDQERHDHHCQWPPQPPHSSSCQLSSQDPVSKLLRAAPAHWKYKIIRAYIPWNVDITTVSKPHLECLHYPRTLLRSGQKLRIDEVKEF